MRIPGIIGNTPSIQIRIDKEMFFDRQSIINALTEMELRAFTKASLKVKDRAKRIIKKRGLARIPFKLQERFPGAGISTLVQMGVLAKTERGNRNAGRRIIREVQNPPASPPGSPPYTHTPYSGHFASYIGFRRNLWNVYDRQTHSAVIGPSKKGRPIPYLHEFGGTMQLMKWAFIPQISTRSGTMRQPIVMNLPRGQKPRNLSKWRPMGLSDGAVYPARPFMKPAMDFCVANGSIARAFTEEFRNVPGGRGTGHRVRIG